MACNQTQAVHPQVPGRSGRLGWQRRHSITKDASQQPKRPRPLRMSCPILSCPLRMSSCTCSSLCVHGVLLISQPCTGTCATTNRVYSNAQGIKTYPRYSIAAPDDDSVPRAGKVGKVCTGVTPDLANTQVRSHTTVLVLPFI